MSPRDQIITSEAANRMLDRTSPIYDNSATALHVFEAMGKEYDTLKTIVDEFPAQLNPETATWLLPLWERRYGLETDTSLSIKARRTRIRLRRKHTGAFNPAKVIQIVNAITGLTPRVSEFADDYTFAVYLPAVTANDNLVDAAIRKPKPSHLSFVIRYEQMADAQITVGGNIDRYTHFELTQAE